MDVYFRAAAAIEAEVESGLGKDAVKLRKKYPRRKDLPFIEAKDASSDVTGRKKWKSSELRLWVYKIAMTTSFDQLIAFSIIINVPPSSKAA